MYTIIDTDTFSVSTTLTKLPAPLRGAGIPLIKLKNEILGIKYELSMLYTGDTLSQRLNREYRDKNYPTNVLSFPLSKTSGELFLNIRKIERELKHWDRALLQHVGMLAIHGMLHLKGFEHGERMEKEELCLGKKYNLLRIRPQSYRNPKLLKR